VARDCEPVLFQLSAFAGMTQFQLSERAGLPRQVVGEIERGAPTNPGWQLVRPLIDVLDVELVPGRRGTFPARGRSRGLAAVLTYVPGQAQAIETGTP
jgi:DNA-binding XRE family transcriptional regulator